MVALAVSSPWALRRRRCRAKRGAPRHCGVRWGAEGLLVRRAIPGGDLAAPSPASTASWWTANMCQGRPGGPVAGASCSCWASTSRLLLRHQARAPGALRLPSGLRLRPGDPAFIDNIAVRLQEGLQSTGRTLLLTSSRHIPATFWGLPFDRAPETSPVMGHLSLSGF